MGDCLRQKPTIFRVTLEATIVHDWSSAARLIELRFGWEDFPPIPKHRYSQSRAGDKQLALHWRNPLGKSVFALASAAG
jgi:hypothetical protein